MEKSKVSVIQDDILAAKYALANGVAFEGLEGDDLRELLQTLMTQRAQVIVSAKRELTDTSQSTFDGNSSSMSTTSTPTRGGPAVDHLLPQPPRLTVISRKSEPKKSRLIALSPPRAKARRKSLKKRKSKGSSSLSSPEAPSANTKSHQNNGGSGSGSGAIGETGGSSNKKRHQTSPPSPSGDNGSSKKSKKKEPGKVDLRHLRKNIKVGDFVSVLMEIRLPDGWVTSWVRGEVLREVSTTRTFLCSYVQVCARTPQV